MVKSTRSVAFVILIGVAAQAVFAVTDGENSQVATSVLLFCFWRIDSGWY